MRDIEGIDVAIEELSRHMPQIEEHFNAENEKYKLLLEQDPNKIGRILKCHLIIEKYLDDYIIQNKKIDNLSELKLTFHQKVSILPREASSAAIVRPGIMQINKIRNKFSHNLNASIVESDISAINELLSVARPNTIFNDNIEKIEAFTTVACTWLMVTPEELTEKFQQAFRNISVVEIDE